jgi:predicted amidohydrolase YtcJ
MRSWILGAVVALLLLAPVPSIAKETADTILHNGKIITVDKDFSIAQAVAVKDGMIMAVGKNSQILKLSGPKTKKIDLKRKTVIPGLTDAHAHMDREGLKYLNTSLAGAKSIDDILRIIGDEVKKAKPGEWIVTMPIGDPPFFENAPAMLKENRFPTRWELDKVSPDNPVYIKGIWGYWDKPPIVSVANSYALRLANITKDTVPPYDGIKILKDPNTGEPTGVITESSLVGSVEFTLMKVAPRFTYELRVKALKDSQRMYLSQGVTSIYEGHGVAPEVIAAYKELHDAKELMIRSYLVLSPTPGKSASELEVMLRDWATYASGSGLGDSVLKMGGIYIGDIGNNANAARLRAAEAPYTAWAGFYYDDFSPERFRDAISLAAKYGLRVNIIAVDPKSIDNTLSVFEEVNKTYRITDKRWVFQHARTFSPAQIDRLKKLNLIPEVIPAKSTVWKGGSARLKALPPERKSEFAPFKSLIRAGLPLVLATDNAPYEPFITLYAAVARKDKDTGEIILPNERLTREEALRAMTINGAYETFQEQVRGSIEKGKYADLAVLKSDYLTVPEESIKDIEVLMTMVGGRIVYEKR